MSATVCRNLVSCFQTDKDTTAVKLQLKPPVSTVSEMGNWGFFETTTVKEPIGKQSYNSRVSAYSSSFPKLSSRSLDLCTELLGSESGSDIVTERSILLPEINGFSNNFDAVNENPEPKKISSEKTHQIRDRNFGKKPNFSFPPPLTTMSGPTSWQMQRHIEDGRLIIKAVESPFRNSLMQVERSNGNLKLSFLINPTSPAEEEEREAIFSDVDPATAEQEIIDRFNEESESKNEDFDEEITLESGYMMPRRCKEGSHGGRGFCNDWKAPLWVGTS